MSLECPTNPVYRTSVEQKKHSQNAAKVYRYGSPKIRDQLRDKCRIRVREARLSNFNQRRLVDIAEELDLDAMLREEVAGLESDLRLQEEIFKELRDEMNEWFIQELEAEETALINAAADEYSVVTTVMCPICQQSNLVPSTIATDKENINNYYHCKCGVGFSFADKPLELRKLLHAQVDVHGQKCDADLTFYLEPQSVGNAEAPIADTSDNNLCAICDKCDYFYSF